MQNCRVLGNSEWRYASNLWPGLCLASAGFLQTHCRKIRSKLQMVGGLSKRDSRMDAMLLAPTRVKMETQVKTRRWSKWWLQSWRGSILWCLLSLMRSSKLCIAKLPYHRTTGSMAIEYIWIVATELQFSSSCLSILVSRGISAQRNRKTPRLSLHSEATIDLVCNQSEQNMPQWLFLSPMVDICPTFARTSYLLHLSKLTNTVKNHWPLHSQSQYPWFAVIGLTSHPRRSFKVRTCQIWTDDQWLHFVDLRPLSSYQNIGMNSLLPHTIMISSC